MLYSSLQSTLWPKQTYSHRLVHNDLLNTFIKEPIIDIRNNPWALQNRKLLYDHTEQIWTHNWFDKREDYSRSMDIYTDEYTNKRYCLNQDPESQHFIYLVCQDFLPLSPIIKQTVPLVRRSRKDTLRQTIWHRGEHETRYFSLYVPFDHRPENKNDYDYAFDCALMSDLVGMASDMEFGSSSNNRRYETKKQDWTSKNIVSKHIFYDFGACWIYDLPKNKKYTNQFFYYLSQRRSGYTFEYDKKTLSDFIGRLQEIYTHIASEKKLHQIHDAVLQSNFVSYVDLSQYKRPAERWLFSPEEKITFIAKNTQLTLLSRITSMINVTEEMVQKL